MNNTPQTSNAPVQWVRCSQCGQTSRLAIDSPKYLSFTCGHKSSHRGKTSTCQGRLIPCSPQDDRAVVTTPGANLDMDGIWESYKAAGLTGDALKAAYTETVGYMGGE